MKPVVLLFSLFFSTLMVAQSPKKIVKQAKKDFNNQHYKEAADGFSKAIQLKPNDYKLFMARALAYEKIPDTLLSIADYKQAVELKPKDKKTYMKIADLAMATHDFKTAVTYLEKYMAKDATRIDVLQKISFSYLNLKQFQTALEMADRALAEQKMNHLSHYYKALALDSLGQYGTAHIEYTSAIKIMKGLYAYGQKPDAQYKPYYANHALVLYRIGEFDESIKEYETAVSLDVADRVEPKQYRVFYLEHQPYLKKSDFTNAIGYLNKSIALNAQYTDAFYARALVYKQTSQFHSAISDYTKVLQLQPKNYMAFYERAQCYIELANYPNAITDLKQANQLQPANTSIQYLLRKTVDKDYNANRENDAPTLLLLSPQTDNNGFINVYDVQQNILIEGEVKDKSLIDKITINDQKVKFNASDKNPIFSCFFPNSINLSKLEIAAKDVYGNVTSKTIKVGHIIETTRQRVHFAGYIQADNTSKTPYANQSIYLTNVRGEVFFKTQTDIEGRFKFDNLPFDRSYLLSLDTVKNEVLKTVNRFVVSDGKGHILLTSSSPQKGKFNFEIIPSDAKTLELITVNDAPIKIDLRGKLIAANGSRAPLSAIKFLLTNESNEVIAFNITDAEGNFSFPNLMPNAFYGFAIDALDVGKIAYEKIYVTDENGKIIKEISKNTDGTFKFKFLESERAMLSALAQDEFDPWININFTTQKAPVEIIENIYYESGSYKVLPAAEAVLQKAITAMQKNPTLLLEIQSHTDATASDEYNMDLSQKRANAVADFLIANGIAAKRITAKGYGETQLINRCVNGVECSDEEHKQNRRTVFKLSYPQ
ncbi:MAG: OmpA family protein [Bacteroidetes bacterium]|nr:OmpA family protein [Bacteroidota bacterium]